MGRSRIEREKRTVEQMIRLYCRRKEGNAGALCSDCRELLGYALSRLERCPHGEGKTDCRHCPTHCYSPAWRARIRAVMRWAGPRMPLYHPLAALRHLLER